MDLARAIGLSTARVRKDRTATGMAFLVVERYDRHREADTIQRVHQEDFCQALGRPSDRKYQAEGGPSVAEAVQLLRRCTPVPALQLPRFWSALVFHWVIGNCDAHAKNFSLLYQSRSPTLAPLYDLVCTAVYPELTTRLAMTIDGATDIADVDIDAWAALAAEVDLGEGFARRSAADILERAAAAASALVATDEHDNPVAEQIQARVAALVVR